MVIIKGTDGRREWIAGVFAEREAADRYLAGIPDDQRAQQYILVEEPGLTFPVRVWSDRNRPACRLGRECRGSSRLSRTCPSSACCACGSRVCTDVVGSETSEISRRGRTRSSSDSIETGRRPGHTPESTAWATPMTSCTWTDATSRRSATGPPATSNGCLFSPMLRRQGAAPKRDATS